MKYLPYIINNEKFAIFCLHGKNRDKDIIDWHRRVMVEHFGLTINYIECPFPGYSHGYFMNAILSSVIDTEDVPDYFWFIDNDSIILKREAIDLIYNFVSNKITIFGHAWMSNHKFGPRGVVHAYASQACLCFSSALYNKLGRPDCDHHNPRSDTAEELTYRAKEAGYIISLIYPSHVFDPNTPLDNSCFQGLGNTYGPDMFYHSSQQNNPKSKELFIQKCKEIIAGKI